MNPYRIPELSTEPAISRPSSEGIDDGFGLCLVAFLLGVSRVVAALWVGGELGAEPTFAMLLAVVSGREVARALWGQVGFLR